MRNRIKVHAAALFICLLLPAAASAESPADFYSKAKMRFIVGAGAVLGVVLAFVALRTLQQFDLGPTVTVLVGKAHLDVSVLLVTIAIAIVSAPRARTSSTLESTLSRTGLSVATQTTGVDSSSSAIGPCFISPAA